MKPVLPDVNGAIREIKPDPEKGTYDIVLDQSAVRGWTSLGTYYLQNGRQEFVELANRTTTDGLYAIFDAIRLTPRK
jgi:hypothetical protein